MALNQTKIDETTMAASGYWYEFGRFQLKVEDSGQTLFSEGHPVALSTVESTVLRVLLERSGQFVKTDDLLKCISPSSAASENLVHGAVRGLRRTLNDADLIKNERSKGYFFTGDVERRVLTAARVAEPDRALVGPTHQPKPDKSGNHQAVMITKGRDPFVVVALLVTAPVVVLPFGLVLFGGNWETLPRQLGFIQALMILVAIGYDFYFSDTRAPRQVDAETGRALLAIQQFRRFWRLVLVSWCCLYIILPFSGWFPSPSSGQAPSWQWQALQIVATLLNNCSALMLVLCYAVLNRPTIVKVADRDVEDISLKPGLLLIVGIGLLEASLVAFFGRLGRADYAGDVLFGFDLLSGVVGGIAMALCISRLDSRLLGSSGLLPVVPIVLYLYVVIQPFYPFVNRTFPNGPGVNHHFDLWIIQLAFLLKSVMYIYVTQLLRTERFLFYMIHARRVYENVETEWGKFQAVRGS